MATLPSDYKSLTREAVAHYWKTLSTQGAKQGTGDADRGRRRDVTGGKQMNGFCRLISRVLTLNGLPEAHVFTERNLELPGFFRPSKKWDMVVVYEGKLVAALEFKSQRGPSFGNNYNNRTEEAVGTASDFWAAHRAKAFGKGPKPWLGWLTLLEDCPESTRPVKVNTPHFPALPDFEGTSYAKRYQLTLRKLRAARLFNATSFLMCTEEQGQTGQYTEPDGELGIQQFLESLAQHVAGITRKR
jgi:hypothetical protein